VLPDQRNELLRGNQERNRVNKTEQPQNNKARQPVRISASEKLSKDIIHQGVFSDRMNRISMIEEN
jgi:hypothetical protein